MSEAKKTEALSFLRKNIWLLLMLAAGILLLLPGSSDRKGNETEILTEEEQRLSGALSRMEGVGEVYVLLAEKPGREEGYSGAVVVCTGAPDPVVQLRIIETVSAFTGLGSNRIVVQKMIS